MAISTSSAYHSEALLAELTERARELRLDSLEMIHRRGAGHPGGSLSAAEIMAALFFHKLNLDPARPDWPERDRFILSKGHASAILYAALARRGFFPRADLRALGRPGLSPAGPPGPAQDAGRGHDARACWATASPIGVGLALAARRLKLSYRIYVLLGDGECQGGHRLGRRDGGREVPPVQPDRHPRLQRRAARRRRCTTSCRSSRWSTSGASFNWAVLEINGHNLRQVLEALDTASEIHGRPTIIIAHTTKGKGVSFMEDRSYWHGVAPNDAQLAQAVGELERCA